MTARAGARPGRTAVRRAAARVATTTGSQSAGTTEETP